MVLVCACVCVCVCVCVLEGRGAGLVMTRACVHFDFEIHAQEKHFIVSDWDQPIMLMPRLITQKCIVETVGMISIRIILPVLTP